MFVSSETSFLNSHCSREIFIQNGYNAFGIVSFQFLSSFHIVKFNMEILFRLPLVILYDLDLNLFFCLLFWKWNYFIKVNIIVSRFCRSCSISGSDSDLEWFWNLFFDDSYDSLLWALSRCIIQALKSDKFMLIVGWGIRFSINLELLSLNCKEILGRSYLNSFPSSKSFV